LGNSRYLERYADELNECLFRPYITLLLISKIPSSASNLSELIQYSEALAIRTK
jgi:hypothetical protein